MGFGPNEIERTNDRMKPNSKKKKTDKPNTKWKKGNGKKNVILKEPDQGKDEEK